MQIPESAEREDLTIQGLTFSVPVVVDPTHFDDSINPIINAKMAAQILNQTLKENWRNNFAKTVTKAVVARAKELGFEGSKVSEIDDETAQRVFDEMNESGAVAELQSALDSYIAEYEPGIRRTSGGGESLSPVDREARKMALDIVRNYLEAEMGIGKTARSESYKKWDAKLQEEEGITAAEYVETMAENLLEKNPQIREEAKTVVERRKSMAANVSLDFSGTSADEAA